MAKGWFGNILKGAWNIGKGVLKKIPLIGGAVTALENLNFGKGAKNLEDGKGSIFGDALGAALPGLISGGANLLTSHFSSKAVMRQRKELMDYQHNLSQQDYQQELADKLQLINEDRKYNSIGAQMARAEQAGVSPLAALGVSAGNSVGASSPTHQAVNAPAMGNNILENIATLKQLDMMKQKNDAEVYRLKQAAELDKAKAKTEEQNAVMAEIRASNLSDFQKAELENLVAEKGVKVARAELDKMQTQHLSKSSDLLIEGLKLDNEGKEWRNALDKERALFARRNGAEMSRGMDAALSSIMSFIFGSPKHVEMLIKAHHGDASLLNGLGKEIYDLLGDKGNDSSLLRQLLEFTSASPDTRIRALAAIIARILEQQQS